MINFRNKTSGSDWMWFPTRIAIYLRDEFTCLACGATRGLSLDHIVPRSEGGGNEPENLITLCVDCNTQRGVMALDEWSPPVWREAQRAIRRPLNRELARAIAELARPDRFENARTRKRGARAA